METETPEFNDDSSDSWTSHHPTSKLKGLHDSTVKSVASQLIWRKIRDLHLNSQEQGTSNQLLAETNARKTTLNSNTNVPAVNLVHKSAPFGKSSYSDDERPTEVRCLNATTPPNWKLSQSDYAINERVRKPSAKLAKMEKILSDGRHVISKDSIQKVREIVEKQLERERKIAVPEENMDTAQPTLVVGVQSDHEDEPAEVQDKPPPKRKLAVVSAFSEYAGLSKSGSRNAVWIHPHTKPKVELARPQGETHLKRQLPTRKVARVVADNDFVSAAHWRLEREAVSKIIKSMFTKQKQPDKETPSKREASFSADEKTSIGDSDHSSSSDGEYQHKNSDTTVKQVKQVTQYRHVVPLTRRNLMAFRSVQEDTKPKKVEKVRHYDRDAVQEYILKQKAERRRRQLEEKRKQEALKQRAEFVKKYMLAVRLANAAARDAEKKTTPKLDFNKQATQEIHADVGSLKSSETSHTEDAMPCDEGIASVGEQQKDNAPVDDTSMSNVDITKRRESGDVLDPEVSGSPHPSSENSPSQSGSKDKRDFQSGGGGGEGGGDSIPEKVDQFRTSVEEHDGSQMEPKKSSNSSQSRWPHALKRKSEGDIFDGNMKISHHHFDTNEIIYPQVHHRSFEFNLRNKSAAMDTTEDLLFATDTLLHSDNSENAKSLELGNKDNHVITDADKNASPKSSPSFELPSSELDKESFPGSISETSVTTKVYLEDLEENTSKDVTKEVKSGEVCDNAISDEFKVELTPVLQECETNGAIIKDSHSTDTSEIPEEVQYTLSGSDGEATSDEFMSLLFWPVPSDTDINGIDDVSEDTCAKEERAETPVIVTEEKRQKDGPVNHHLTEESSMQNSQDEKMDDSFSLASSVPTDEDKSMQSMEEKTNDAPHELSEKNEAEKIESVCPDLSSISFFAKNEDDESTLKDGNHVPVEKESFTNPSENDDDDDKTIHEQVVKAVSSIFETSSPTIERSEVPNLEVVAKAALSVDLEEDTLYEISHLSSPSSSWPTSDVSQRINSIRAATKDKPLYTKESSKLRPQDMMILTAITDDTEMAGDIEGSQAPVSSPTLPSFFGPKVEEQLGRTNKTREVEISAVSQTEGKEILGLLDCYSIPHLHNFLMVVAHILYEAYQQGIPFSQAMLSEENLTGHQVLKEATAERQRYHMQFLFDLCKDVCTDLFNTKQLKSIFMWNKFEFAVKPLVPQSFSQLFIPMKQKVLTFLTPSSVAPSSLTELESLTDILKKKKGDKLDRILYEELKKEEPEWRNFEEEEEAVKQALVNSILDHILEDTVGMLKNMRTK